MKKNTPVEQKRVIKKYFVDAKSVDYIFCPANAIDDEFYHRSQDILPELVTNDGVIHKCEFLNTWNNADGVFDEEFDDLCMRRYGVPFVSIKSMWIGRLGKLDNYWHLIKLD